MRAKNIIKMVGFCLCLSFAACSTADDVQKPSDEKSDKIARERADGGPNSSLNAEGQKYDIGSGMTEQKYDIGSGMAQKYD